MFGRDGRYGYVFGRDGGLSKVDLLERRLAERIVQAGNAIGGAISDDGRLIAVSNYEPGGVRVFDAATLAAVADIPARWGDDGRLSKTVGLVDLPGHGFAWSLYDAGEIWVADLADPAAPQVRRFPAVGKLPYDGNVTPDGRFYLAGLFGEDGLALLDLWDINSGPRRILNGTAAARAAAVYKMPHLEGWASVGDELFLPAVRPSRAARGRQENLGGDEPDRAGRSARVCRCEPERPPHLGQLRPSRQRSDPGRRRTEPCGEVATLQPGTAILHIEFTPRGEQAWVSAREADNAILIHDTDDLTRLTTVDAQKPSGIFFTARANRIGQ